MAASTGHRIYSLLLAGIAVAAAAGFGLYGRSLEPLSGDLTRIGWYTENEFGWTLPEPRFDRLLAPPAQLDGHYDILAVGDSFTAESGHNHGTTWPHFLARDTGLAVGVFDIGVDRLDGVLASPVFRDHPPALLIYEIVERSFIPEHRRGGTGDCAVHVPTPQPELNLAPLDVAAPAVTRPTARAWDEWPASYAMDLVLQNTIRWLRGHETTSAVRLTMAADGLFSSRFDRGLLVYGEDFNKMGWRAEDWTAAICDLARIQDRVQANGRTAFLAMIVPDKLTVYTPFLADPRFAGLSHLDRLGEVAGLNLVRIDRLLDPRAHVDLYLPNDTHWSSSTHAMAAEAVIRTLAERGLVAQR